MSSPLAYPFTAAEMLAQINKWSAIYQFSFQFWGDNNNNLFIEKDGVDVHSCGGFDTPEEVLATALAWVNKQNPKGFPGNPKEKLMTKRNLCQGCGATVAKGNDFCGECLCEDDGYI